MLIKKAIESLDERVPDGAALSNFPLDLESLKILGFYYEHLCTITITPNLKFHI